VKEISSTPGVPTGIVCPAVIPLMLNPVPVPVSVMLLTVTVAPDAVSVTVPSAELPMVTSPKDTSFELSVSTGVVTV
jgi:hypothetical protein